MYQGKVQRSAKMNVVTYWSLWHVAAVHKHTERQFAARGVQKTLNLSFIRYDESREELATFVRIIVSRQCPRSWKDKRSTAYELITRQCRVQTYTEDKLAPRGAWLHQKSCQEISCTVVALFILKKCVSSDALWDGRSARKQLKAYLVFCCWRSVGRFLVLLVCFLNGHKEKARAPRTKLGT